MNRLLGPPIVRCLARELLAREVEVGDAHHLGRALAQPAVDLVDSRVDADEVHAGQMDRRARGVDRPVDVDGRGGALVGVVVGISEGEAVEGVVGPRAAQVDAVLRQARPLEGELVVGEPLRVVGLQVRRVHGEVARLLQVVLPADVLLGGGAGLLCRAVVGDAVAELRAGVVARLGRLVEPRLGGRGVGAAGNLVPFVLVGTAVRVGVPGHLDDARLAAAVCALAAGVEGVAQHAEVAQPGAVLNRVVEADDDVAAETAQRDHAPAVVADGFERLAVHVSGVSPSLYSGSWLTNCPGAGRNSTTRVT